MMPKGVEHKNRWSRRNVLLVVRIPMMPKGVEHWSNQLRGARPDKVRIPMMPKGVEHAMHIGRLMRVL